MSDSKPIIAANWKMNKTPLEGYKFAKSLVTKALNIAGADFILAPSATALWNVHEALDGANISLAGQNMHFAEAGAYTGETSATMLKACGCDSVILGHSERRHVFGETGADINRKIKAALATGLNVIHCIGELLADRESGNTAQVLREQLASDLDGIEEFPTDRIIIAYEPVWAIGTGVVATVEQAGEAHDEVRSILGMQFPKLDTSTVSILYGGSVKSSNAAELIKTQGIDGFLIGGASLDLDEYCKIAEIAQMEASG
ncbi:triose-phosphate isomerase [Candidatus Neomarinimicrobiota bacterium]